MKKYVLSLLGVCLLCVLCGSCKDDESYAEKKESERKVIKAFVARQPLVLLGANNDTLLDIPRIVPIEQEVFEAQDSMTDASKNEFVLFKNTGIYMQIVHRGKGEKLKPGETARVICRYWEYNILGDSLQSTSIVPYWATNPDIMDVSNNSGTISASFNTTVNSGGSMYATYASTSTDPTKVLKAWVLPLSYINLGRYTTGADDLALVRLIVPHSQGTDNAANAVYPCFYEITYERMPN